jgi:multidrug efflux system membrane fusion protein
MHMDEQNGNRRRVGTVLSILIIALAVVSLAIVIAQITAYPRTDDAEVFANFIGIAPQVEGPITHLEVRDNQFVRAGDLLYTIDDRPYQYALERAQSDKAALEGQIVDEQRRISAQQSGVAAARAGADNQAAEVLRSQAVIHQEEADVDAARAGILRAQAELDYATSNLKRLQPLLQKQYVTPDQVQQAETAVQSREQELNQARSNEALAQARLAAAHASHTQSQAGLTQSNVVVTQTQQGVLTLEPLVAQRGARTAAVSNALYDLTNCRVYAPFDARVTDLTISEGAYAHKGQQIFTLIDARVWWVVANFRETQLHRVQPGMAAEVRIMSHPEVAYRGVVESTGYGVLPDPERLGRLTPGLPDVQRTINWGHLATRYPVRIRIEAPDTGRFRIGESAVVIIRGDHTTANGS